MKKVAFLSILAMSMIAIFSCSKQGSTQIEGQVIEKGSNKPIANAKVVISQCVKGDGFGSSAICIEIDTLLTDSKGSYMYSNDDKDALDYRLSVYKDNYMMEIFQVANAGQSSKNIDFVMRANAWIKFHIKNISPFDDEDLIIAPGAVGTSSYHFHRKNVDTTYILGRRSNDFYFTGNQLAKFSWITTKNMKTVTKKDSVFIKALDTVYYEIKY